MLQRQPAVRTWTGMLSSRFSSRIPHTARRIPVQCAFIPMSVFLGMFPAELHADSDGYFCSGRGYVAIQLRSWSTGGPHLLQVAAFADGAVRQVGTVELEDFQPHRMSCEPERIRISGYGIGFIAYDIDVTNLEAVRVRALSRDSTASWLAGLPRDPPVNIGEYARADTVRLTSSESGPDYAIAITVDERAVSGGIEHHITSTLIARDAAGRVTAGLRLYEGTRFESVHEGGAALPNAWARQASPGLRARITADMAPSDDATPRVSPFELPPK